MLAESPMVAQAQLAEKLASPQYNTLHSDGTTKFSEHYDAVEMSTESGTYTVGIIKKHVFRECTEHSGCV